MVYTAEEKLRMDRLAEAFRDYIAKNEEIDVAYSEKTGYVRLIIAEYADSVFFPITDFDDMLQMFFCDILEDEVVRAFTQGEDVDPDRPYRSLSAILNTLDADREYALNELDACMVRWRQRDIKNDL